MDRAPVIMFCSRGARDSESGPMSDSIDRSLDRRPHDWSSSWRPAGLRTPEGTALSPGEILAGRYRIDEFVARGGMGVVYRVTDLDLGVVVALKTICPEIASDPPSLRRFKREVLLARLVSSPHVCRTFDIGRDSARNLSFLTMEFLEGETLADRLRRRRRLPTDEIMHIVEDVAEALDAAHRAGIIHRDFKSANIMLVSAAGRERAIVTDFGLAATVSRSPYDLPQQSQPSFDSPPSDGDERVPVLGSLSDRQDETSPVEVSSQIGLIGTPAYMSPEQVRGESLGPSADLYALGVVLFEAVTGRLPFLGRDALETAHARLEAQAPALDRFENVGPNWQTTIRRLLSTDPRERHRSGREVVSALKGRVSAAPELPHSLPKEPESFVGRDRELDQAFQTLCGDHRETPRVVNVIGLGGMGKTALALQFGWRNLAAFPGGIWFCDLSGATTLNDFVAAVAKGLDLKLGAQDPVTQLAHAIAGRGRCLVILDNLEQVAAPSVPAIDQWLGQSLQAGFLVTSRERLSGFSIETIQLDSLDPATEGVELLSQRARSHGREWTGHDVDHEVATELVARLDGIPLAIELAAARLRMMSLRQLLDRLESRFEVLSSPQGGRHGTLQATLDWSWELLNDCEQSAVMQSAVFRRGFFLESAESVIEIEGAESVPFVLDVLQSLVDKNWIRVREVKGLPRFEMYETVQDYARGRLAARSSDELSRSAERRHVAHYATFGSKVYIRSLDEPGGEERRARLETELENLVHACQRAYATGDEAAATATFLAVDAVLMFRGPLSASVSLGSQVLMATAQPQLRRRVLTALAATEVHTGHREDARSHGEEALTLARSDNDRPGEAAARMVLGNLHREQGRMSEAHQEYRRAQYLYEEEGDLLPQAKLSMNLGILHWQQGQMEEALACYEEALPRLRRIGNQTHEAMALGNLALFYSDQGSFEKAREHADASLRILTEVGDRPRQALALSYLGSLDLATGRLDQANRHYAAALTILREVGSRQPQGSVLANQASIHRRSGRISEAIDTFNQALAIHREVGDRRGQGIVYGELGSIYTEMGQSCEARSSFEKALSLQQETGNRYSEAIVLGNLGSLLLHELGEIDEAERLFGSAMEVARELGDRVGEATGLQSLGLVHMARSNWEEAQAHLTEGLDICRSIGDLEGEGATHVTLGQLFLRQSQLDEGRRSLEQGLKILEDTGLRLEYGKALCSLGELESKAGNQARAKQCLAEAESLADGLGMSGNSRLTRAMGDLRKQLGEASGQQ